ncbi:DoxX family membrane protein [bacterium]|nr:MAG: DoxX family membrane protein [bacterium]
MGQLRMPHVIFALRVAIGSVLVVAGALKAPNPTAFASTIAGFQLLPAAVAGPMAVFVPWFEILLGGYLIAGYLTRAAAWVACAEFVVFAGAIASVVVRGIHISCGCFGQGDAAPASWVDVVRDAALAAGALVVALRPPGVLAVDRRELG